MTTTDTTIDRAEIDRFDRLSAEWWDPDGQLGQLHRMNPLRIGYIRDAACRRFGRDPQDPGCLSGLTALDVGCGGGLLTEPIARLGAQVTGLDASAEAIGVARRHADHAGLTIDYACETAEHRAATGAQFDMVLALEIVEHVSDVDAFVTALARLTRPGGLVVMSTLNRTLRSLALAIVGAEYLLRWVPPGTHDWRKFIRPSVLSAHLRRHGLVVDRIAGMALNPLSQTWRLAKRDLSVNYLLHAHRPAS